MRHAIGLMLLAGTTLAVTPAGATVMIPQDVPALTRGASDIVEGQVVAVETVLRGGDPWTAARLRVARVHKGKLRPGATISVEQPGGEVGEAGLYVPGTARFTKGERIVAFLFRDGGAFYPYGMAQGVFHVYATAKGELRAARDIDGAAFAFFDPAGVMRLSPAPKALGDTDLPVAELRRRIAAAARRGGPR